MIRALLTIVLLATSGGANQRPSGLQCAGISAHVPEATKTAVIGALDQPGRAAAISNLDIIVYQLEQIPQYSGRGVETIVCLAGTFLASTSERDPHWKLARANLRAWLASHAAGAGGQGGR